MKRLNQQLVEIAKFLNLIFSNKKKYLSIAFFASLTGVFFNLLLAYMLKGIYTAVALKNTHLLYLYITMFVVLLALIFSYNCIFWTLYGSNTARITGNLRRILANKLCSLKLSTVEKIHSGDIMSTFTNDIDAAQGIYVNIRFYISTLLFSIVPSILVFHISPLLGGLIVAFAILQLLINLLVIKPLEKQSIRIRGDMIKLNSTFSDILRNNLSIRLYSSEDFYLNLCRDINKNLYHTKMKLHIITAVTEGANICFGLLGYIVVLLVGSVLISGGNLNLPDLLFITQSRYMMIQGILAFGTYAVQMQPAIVGVRKIMSLMEYESENDIVESI